MTIETVFGFVPLTPLQLYNSDPEKWDSTQDIILAHLVISDSALLNFLGARIPIKSQLKQCKWCYHLNQYWDKQLPDLIQFEFPLDFDRGHLLCLTDKNHASALENPQHFTTDRPGDIDLLVITTILASSMDLYSLGSGMGRYSLSTAQT